MTEHYCFLNGNIISETEAHISIYDVGFLRGYGVFDFIRTYNGKPFLLDEHLERLEKSSLKMGIKLPYDRNKIEKIVNNLIIRNNKGESTIRIVVTGGVSPEGMYPGDIPTFLILTKDLKPIPNKVYKKGVKLMTDEYQRSLPEIKHLNYSNLIRQKKKLNKTNSFNILYVNDGHALESAICNFFIVKDGIVATPIENVLMGTTRNLIIKLAKSKYIFEERQVSVTEMGGADEAFITGTSQGMIPVVEIDGKKIGTGKPGSTTKNLGRILDKYIRAFSGGVGLYQ